MKNLPFVRGRFNLFDKNDILELVNDSGLQIVDFVEKKDVVMSKSGEKVERLYFTIKLKKKQIT